MIYALSIRLTRWFIKHELLKQEDFDVYVYYIDSLLAKVFFYLLLLIIATCFHIIPITIFYYLGFIPFRYTAGGYHAKTELRCTVMSWLVYGLSMLAVVKWGAGSWVPLFSVFTVLLVTIVAWRLAPLDHFNKPVSAAHKQKLRRFCLLFQGMFILLVMMLLWRHDYIYAFSLVLGNGLAGLFLLLAFYQKEKEER